MTVLFQRTLSLLRREDGPTVTEYGVLLALIAVLVLIAMANFGDRVEAIYLALSAAVDVF